MCYPCVGARADSRTAWPSASSGLSLRTCRPVPVPVPVRIQPSQPEAATTAVGCWWEGIQILQRGMLLPCDTIRRYDSAQRGAARDSSGHLFIGTVRWSIIIKGKESGHASVCCCHVIYYSISLYLYISSIYLPLIYIYTRK